MGQVENSTISDLLSGSEYCTYWHSWNYITAYPWIAFQSRSGFSPYCDPTSPMPSTEPGERFNPVLGFLPTATGAGCRRCQSSATFQSRSGFSPYCDESKYSSNLSSALFQSRSGFSPYCDADEPDDAPDEERVSIPFWVFSLLRPHCSPARPRPTHCFNPVLGFLPTATSSGPTSTCSTASFNPVLGFLPTATTRSSPSAARARSFNPVLGFLPTATVDTPGPRDVEVFQSRSGFSPYCDHSATTPAMPAARFQSRSGFSPYCDVEIGLNVMSDAMFQSRSGFSPYCDSFTKTSDTDSSCFNPVLGFLPTATVKFRIAFAWPDWFQSRSGFSPYCDNGWQQDKLGEQVKFQSRSGFSPYCDVVTNVNVSARQAFQSRSGFSPYCDRAALGARRPRRRVSIPFWVFSLLRPRPTLLAH